MKNYRVGIQNESISDQNILSLIGENNLEAWGHLYDKYAPVMFGIVYHLTDDRIVAEEIFKEVFIRLKEDKILSKYKYVLCTYLVRHTNRFTRHQLMKRGLICTQDNKDETSLISILYTQHITMKEAAFQFNFTEEEAKLKLRLEFSALTYESNKQKRTFPENEFNQQYS